MNPELIENAAFFRDSPPEVRAAMLRAAKPAMLHAGDFFYRERELCPHFAYVLGGDIRVYKSDEQGREVTLYHVGADEPCLVNLVSVMLAQPAMADAKAEAQTTAVLFPGAMLDPWMAASAGMRRFVFQTLSGRMAGVMSLVEDIAFRRIDSRLAEWLLQRFAYDRVIEATHVHIAAELGTAREVVTRVVRQLARRGAIQSSRGRIVLRDAEVLRQIM